jgi:hypothetical protein
MTSRQFLTQIRDAYVSYYGITDMITEGIITSIDSHTKQGKTQIFITHNNHDQYILKKLELNFNEAYDLDMLKELFNTG